VKNRALGDTIISLGTIKFLKSILPQTEIYYFVPDWTAPLFQQVAFNSAKIVPFRMHSPGDWISTFKTLRKLKIDAILELSQAGRTGMFFDLYSSVFRVPYFFHNHHSKVGHVRDQGVQKAIIQRDLDAAWTYFGWLQRVPVPNYLDYPPSLGVMEPGKIKRVILGVVATRETKMYPLEKYAEVARLIRQHDIEIEIVAPLSNSDEDKVIADKIKALKSPIQTIVKPLHELPMYFKEALIYIGNDTGLKHLAVAMDLPTVTLFGPEPPIEWHPYDKKKHPYFFRHPLPCRYETGKTYCPLNTCASMICLKDIPPQGVWEKAKELLYHVEEGGSISMAGHTQTGFTQSGHSQSGFTNTGFTQTGSHSGFTQTNSAVTLAGRSNSNIKLPVELERSMMQPQAPSKPIELERTSIVTSAEEAMDLGQQTAVTEIKMPEKKKPDDDPDDDGEKTTVI
jgi:heptosyltransferase-2